ncbi:cellulose biosynthesis protein BcsD [Winslowiella iniecta]|uniref:cellulose biosynthesis protein BcsD n=1 Tax=Winslowiella iniecta TaxID=1560201 RepID=UPI00069EEBF9|nr:cellulose biosynthesis protein BcsD [Winslowiella iniecta]
MSELNHTFQPSRLHSHQPGWFDLLSVIISGMLENAGEQESQLFLQQMGGQLAQRYPLNSAQTVRDLEVQMNLALARFNWGFVDIEPRENALLLTHMALPEGDNQLATASWRAAMGAVLTGLYAGWLQAQGGSERVPLVCDSVSDDAALLFRYQNS